MLVVALSDMLLLCWDAFHPYLTWEFLSWMWKPLSHVQLFVTPWTVAHQAPLSMGFSRQENSGGLPLPPPGNHPETGTESQSPELKADSLLSEIPRNPFYHKSILNFVKYFFCIYWNMIFIINFCNVVYHILICKCRTRDKSHMIIAYDPFNVLLSLWKFWWAFLYLCSSRISASNFLLYPYLASV